MRRSSFFFARGRKLLFRLLTAAQLQQTNSVKVTEEPQLCLPAARAVTPHDPPKHDHQRGHLKTNVDAPRSDAGGRPTSDVPIADLAFPRGSYEGAFERHSPLCSDKTPAPVSVADFCVCRSKSPIDNFSWTAYGERRERTVAVEGGSFRVSQAQIRKGAVARTEGSDKTGAHIDDNNISRGAAPRAHLRNAGSRSARASRCSCPAESPCISELRVRVREKTIGSPAGEKECTCGHKAGGKLAHRRVKEERLLMCRKEAILRMTQGPYPPFPEAVPLAVICRMLAEIWEETNW